MMKQDGEVLTKCESALEADAMSLFAYCDPRNKNDFAGQFDAPSREVKDFQFHHPTCEP